MNTMISVAIVEDQQQTREMLTGVINADDRYLCVGAYESAEEAITNIPLVKADVVLVDIHLPGSSGIECVQALKRVLPAVQFIMCTSLEDSDNIFKALQAGATGYLVKSTPPAKILDSIHDAYNGGAPMSSQIARKVLTFFHQPAQPVSELGKLSTREQEILGYLSKGYRYKEMATLLFISIETVRKHIHNIYEKLQVNSRTDALNKVYQKR
ncbi:MAG: response regulator transcription factor [Bacteroidota bacterium]